MISIPRAIRGGAAVLGACALLALSAGPAAAQATGTVSGTVVDNSNQVVPGATVTLLNEATADARTTVSGGQGTFTFQAVAPGSYTVKIELTGFRSHEQKKNIVNASGQLDLGTLKLDIGTITEVVSVVSEGATIETKNSDYSGLLTSTQISQIQSRGRDVVNLLRLLPGVHYEADIEAMGDSFGSQIPNIGGMRKHWNQVTVDGLNGNELSGTNRMNSSINLDAIAEVKVLLNTYKAEFGPALARHQLFVGHLGEPAQERGRPSHAGRLAALGRERVRDGRLGAGHPHDQ
jgi:type 1 fimbria pilin